MSTNVVIGNDLGGTLPLNKKGGAYRGRKELHGVGLMMGDSNGGPPMRNRGQVDLSGSNTNIGNGPNAMRNSRVNLHDKDGRTYVSHSP